MSNLNAKARAARFNCEWTCGGLRLSVLGKKML
jgi:hypothetical protein